MGRKFTIFALFYFVFEGKFQVQAPRGAYSEGRFNGGFFALRFWGAYIWRGLSSEFYGISVTKKTIIETSTWWTKIHGQYKFIVLLGTLIESTGFPTPPLPASRFPRKLAPGRFSRKILEMMLTYSWFPWSLFAVCSNHLCCVHNKINTIFKSGPFPFLRRLQNSPGGGTPIHYL